MYKILAFKRLISITGLEYDVQPWLKFLILLACVKYCPLHNRDLLKPGEQSEEHLNAAVFSTMFYRP